MRRQDWPTAYRSRKGLVETCHLWKRVTDAAAAVYPGKMNSSPHSLLLWVFLRACPFFNQRRRRVYSTIMLCPHQKLLMHSDSSRRSATVKMSFDGAPQAWGWECSREKQQARARIRPCEGVGLLWRRHQINVQRWQSDQRPNGALIRLGSHRSCFRQGQQAGRRSLARRPLATKNPCSRWKAILVLRAARLL